MGHRAFAQTLVNVPKIRTGLPNHPFFAYVPRRALHDLWHLHAFLERLHPVRSLLFPSDVENDTK